MSRLDHIHCRWARLALASAGALAALLAGCGVNGSSRGAPAEPARLVIGGRAAPLRPKQLRAVGKAAWCFARSYAAAIHNPAAVTVRDATPGLKGELRALRARLPGPPAESAPRLLSVGLDPRAPDEVEATIALKQGGEAPFPIVFVLRLSGGRWLATALPGN